MSEHLTKDRQGELYWKQFPIRQTIFVDAADQVFAGLPLLLGISFFDPGLKQRNELKGVTW